jgi:hypothetical protein
VIGTHDQCRGHERDHQSRDVRQEQRDHPRHHGPDRPVELFAPGAGRPNREPDLARRQHDRERETDSRSHPRRRMLAPSKTTHRTSRQNYLLVCPFGCWQAANANRIFPSRNDNESPFRVTASRSARRGLVRRRARRRPSSSRRRSGRLAGQDFHVNCSLVLEWLRNELR